MITNNRDYLRIKHSVMIEIHSEPNKTTFIKYEETTKEMNMIMTELFDDLLHHLKTHNIINDYAISSI